MLIELVVWQDGGIEKDEEAASGGFDGGDVAAQSGQGRAQSSARFAVNPPVVAVAGAVVLVPLRLDPLVNPLVHRRETRSDLLGGQPEQVDDHHVSRRGRQVAAVAVEADVMFEAGDASQAQVGGFSGVTMKPEPSKLHAGTADVPIGLQRLRTAHIRADSQIGQDRPRPCWQSVISAVPSSPGRSLTTCCNTPGPSPAAPTVIAMRTAAPSALSTQGWSGMANSEVNATCPAEVVFEHAAVEGLAQAVGRDQAEAPRPARPHQLGRLVPPEHHVIGRIRHVGIDAADRLDVAVAQRLAHARRCR